MTAAQKSTALRTSNIGKDDIPLSSDDVFSHVYQAILDRRLPPGTKLREVPLAELFGVTRGTIRKAFTQLANQKVIDLIPNRGASVAYPTVEESRDLFAARRTIESAIVEQLTSRVTKSQIRELNAMVKRENAAYDKGDTREALKLSVDFHRVLATMAGNSVYADFLEQLVTRTPLVVLAYRDPAQATACANQDHQDLVTAIAAGDSVRAINTMRCHLCNLEGQLDLKNSTPSSELAAIFGLNAISHRNAKRNLQ